MKRLALDRLWPMLTVTAVLIVGAVVLQVVARRRGNETIRVVVQAERQLPSDDDERGAGGAAGDEDRPGAPLSELHARARTAARRGHVKEALPLFEAARKEHPDSPELLGESGYWLLLSKQPERALPFLERADQLRPTAQSAVRLGNARRDLDDDAGAVRDYRRALALRPSHVGARIALGNALRRLGATKEAVAVLQEAVTSGSNEERSRAWAGLGWALLSSNRRPEAERAFQKAIELSPARAGVRLAIAHAWQSTDVDEDEVRALRVLQRAAELAPDLPAVWFALGRAHERTGDRAGALEAYDRTLRLDPSHRAARRRSVQIALLTRDLARARRDADRLVADAPEDPDSHFIAATVAEKDGRREDALKAYQEAIAAANGNHPEAWLAVGGLRKAAGDAAGARSAIRKALAKRPDFTAGWLALGRLEESLDRASDAEKAWRRALAIDPKYLPAWLALGQLHAARGRVEEALGDLERALALKPESLAAQLALGPVLVRAGRPADAVRILRSAVGRDPRSVPGWYQLALALRAGGQAGEARSALAKVLELDGSNLPARLELGDLEASDGRLAAARSVLEEARDLAPGDLASRIQLARIAARGGDREGCASSAQALLREAPNDPGVRALPAYCTSTPGGAAR